jgi:hypothetical protein
VYNHIALLIGHLVGDYIFQDDWIATNKSKPGAYGAAVCCLHCSLYAVCMVAAVIFSGWTHAGFDGSFSSVVMSILTVFAIAYVCHYPIDRWGLAGKWMKFYGQTLPGKLDSMFVDGTSYDDGDRQSRSERLYVGFRQYFWAPVYIVVDNTMHLVLMWILLSLLGS